MKIVKKKELNLKGMQYIGYVETSHIFVVMECGSRPEIKL